MRCTREAICWKGDSRGCVQNNSIQGSGGITCSANGGREHRRQESKPMGHVVSCHKSSTGNVVNAESSPASQRSPPPRRTNQNQRRLYIVYPQIIGLSHPPEILNEERAAHRHVGFDPPAALPLRKLTSMLAFGSKPLRRKDPPACSLAEDTARSDIRFGRFDGEPIATRRGPDELFPRIAEPLPLPPPPSDARA